MLNDVLSTVIGFGKEEVECLVRGWQMTVHAVGHESLWIVDMGGGSPGTYCRLDFMARSAKIRRGGAHHGIIGHAEQRKSDYNTKQNERQHYEIFFHDVASGLGL
jgi:hypothetical protein